MCYVARLDAVEGTRFRLLKTLLHLVEERVADGSAGHTDRALDNLDILLFRIEITLLEVIRSVALLGGDKARTHLHCVGTQRCNVVNILSRIDSSAGNYGNLLAVLLLRFVLKKAPKWVNVLLWGIVAVRLICPFSIESALSLIPSKETISPEIMMDWTPEISTGIEPLDQVVNPVISTSFASSKIVTKALHFSFNS